MIDSRLTTLSSKAEGALMAIRVGNAEDKATGESFS